MRLVICLSNDDLWLAITNQGEVICQKRFSLPLTSEQECYLLKLIASELKVQIWVDLSEEEQLLINLPWVWPWERKSLIYRRLKLHQQPNEVISLLNFRWKKSAVANRSYKVLVNHIRLSATMSGLLSSIEQASKQRVEKYSLTETSVVLFKTFYRQRFEYEKPLLLIMQVSLHRYRQVLLIDGEISLSRYLKLSADTKLTLAQQLLSEHRELERYIHSQDNGLSSQQLVILLVCLDAKTEHELLAQFQAQNYVVEIVSQLSTDQQRLGCSYLLASMSDSLPKLDSLVCYPASDNCHLSYVTNISRVFIMATVVALALVMTNLGVNFYTFQQKSIVEASTADGGSQIETNADIAAMTKFLDQYLLDQIDEPITALFAEVEMLSNSSEQIQLVSAHWLAEQPILDMSGNAVLVFRLQTINQSYEHQRQLRERWLSRLQELPGVTSTQLVVDDGQNELVDTSFSIALTRREGVK